MNFKAFCQVFLIAIIAMTSTPINSSATQLAPDLFKTTLDNGLTILVKESPGIKAVTVQIWVKTGSVYEETNEGGITHLIEHMIFKGTPTTQAGGVARAIEEVGGRINAYTYYEYTVYHATLSARHWELALEVLTDAVLNSVYDPDELEREKKVVLEEIAMREDRPRIKLFQELMKQSYQTHPYGLPIIGTRESVSSFTREDVLRYVEKHYHPKNFTVVVTGDVRFSQVEAKTRELLGTVANGDYHHPEMPVELTRKEAKFFKINDDIKQANLAMSFPIAPFKDPNTPVLDVIAGLLGHGETSRLFHTLRSEKGLVFQISASAFTPRDSGLFEIFATLDDEKTAEVIEAALEEIFRLKYIPVAEEELAKVKRNLESEFVFGLEQVEGQARIIGSFEFLSGDPRENAYLSQVRAVTSEDVMRVAGKYFRKERLTAGILLPAEAATALDRETLSNIAARSENLARHGVPGSLVSNAFLPGVHRYRLPNGLRLLVREDPRIETVAIRAIFPGGLRSETEATNGSFAFISELLPKGTTNLSYRELSLKIADMAGSISGFNGKNTFGLTGDFLARYFEPGLELFRDILRKPAFNSAEAEKVRPELLAILKQQQDSLPSVAFLNFNQTLFQGHPYGLNTAGSETAIRSFTVEELRRIYNQHAQPNQMVLAVAGAVKADEVRDLVEKLFGDWQPPTAKKDAAGSLEEIKLPPEPPIRPDLVKIVREKEQLHIVIGFLGTTLSGEDRYALEVLDTVLNGQSGRLFSELRDKKSLAYSLSSFNLLGLDTGSFGIYIGTSPEKQEEVIQEVWQELFRTRQEPVTSSELVKAKNMIISQYELGLQTHSAQAMDLGLNETYELGLDFGTRYLQAIEEVTPEQVLEVARKYILSDHYVMVTVGAEPSAESIPPATSEPEETAPPAVIGAEQEHPPVEESLPQAEPEKNGPDTSEITPPDLPTGQEEPKTNSEN